MSEESEGYYGRKGKNAYADYIPEKKMTEPQMTEDAVEESAKTSWIDEQIAWCEPRKGSHDLMRNGQLLEILEALKAAREALETAIVRNVPEVEPYLSAVRKIDALGGKDG